MPNKIEVELRGPEFTQSAVEISQGIATVNSITKLFIFNMTADCIKSLEGALRKLRAYFATDAIVIINTSQTLPNNAKAILQSAAGVPIQISQSMLSIPFSPMGTPQRVGSMQSEGISSQINADAQKQKNERWKIMQETQTKIFEITQDVTVNKAKTADKAFRAMDGYIRS